MTTPLFELRSVTATHDDGTVALRDCSLSLGDRERSFILGVNGSGKTSLLLLLDGLMRPAGGELLFRGSPFRYDRRCLTELRRRVGILFQNPDSQLFSASIREDVSFGPVNMGLSTAEVGRRVEGALEMVGLREIADRPVHSLSFGQKKRAALAGLLAMEPEVVLLDEPFDGLDPPMRESLRRILDRLSGAGVTVIMTGHDVDLAWEWSDRIFLLHDGRCVDSCGRGELARDPSRLGRYGFPPPVVPRLHRELVRRGVVSEGDPPKSPGDLASLLSRQ